MAYVQVRKLDSTKVACQFWRQFFSFHICVQRKQRNCVSVLDREIIGMKLHYISMSASKAVNIKGTQIITGKASGHKEMCYTVKSGCMNLQNCTTC